jgi:hypothetical protein
MIGRMSVNRARFFHDWRAGWLWASDEATRGRFGYAIDLSELGLPPDVVAEGARLGSWLDTALNWDSPPDPGPWREEECRRFNACARVFFERLSAALGSGWEIVDEFVEQHEDPDLDGYLADPRAFRRAD